MYRYIHEKGLMGTNIRWINIYTFVHVLKHHDKSGFDIFVIVDWEWKQEQGIIKSREDHIRLPADEEREPIHDRENQT